MTTSETEVTAGTVLHDTYEIGRQLGEGGMGTVWEARHLRLAGKRCAVKVLHGQASTDHEAFARFKREADIASRLGHPNIVEVSDWNQLPSGTPYMVLEYLDGEDLAARLARGAVPVDQALSIARQIGAALKAAHAADVVHRDLKPGNVYLVARDVGGEMTDHVKVLDFGISKMKNSQTVQTQDAVLLGTPQYMAPEQALGKNNEIDSRTDIFALGAICYEMLAGRAPFQGNSLAEVVFKVVYEPVVPLTQVVAGLDPVIAAAIEKAMAKTPADRFPDVSAFITALTGRALATSDRRVVGQTVPATNARSSAVPSTAHATDAPASHLRGELQAVPPAKGSSRWLVFLMAAIVVGAGGTLGALKLLGGSAGTHTTQVDPVPKTSDPKAGVPQQKTDVAKTDVPKTDVAKTDVAKTDVAKTDVPPVHGTSPKTGTPTHAETNAVAKKEDHHGGPTGGAESPEAKAMLDQAEASMHSHDFAQARIMADRSLRVQKTSRAFAIITRAHCGDGDLGNAKATYQHVAASDRARVRKECATHEIDLN